MLAVLIRQDSYALRVSYLWKRLEIVERRDQGVNPLDENCKKPDTAYSQNEDVEEKTKQIKFQNTKRGLQFYLAKISLYM